MAEKPILVRNSIKRKFCWRMVEGELCSPGCFCIGKWRQRGICIFPGETTRGSTITTRKKYLYAQISYTMVLTSPFGLVAFVMICVFFFCHNFFVDRNQTWKSKTWSRKRDRMRLTQSRHHRMWNSVRPQADVSVIQTLVTDLNHACSQGKPNFYLS